MQQSKNIYTDYHGNDCKDCGTLILSFSQLFCCLLKKLLGKRLEFCITVVQQ